MSETLPDEPSAIVYRHKKGGLRVRVAFFGGAGVCAILLPLVGLPFGGGFPLEAVPCMFIGAAMLASLFIVVRAERRGRPCLVLREDRFTYLGYLKVKDAKWADLGVFTMHVRTPSSDDSSNASSEPTRSLRAWVAPGASGGAPRKKPDFVIEDYFDASLDELQLVLNRHIEAAKGARL